MIWWSQNCLGLTNKQIFRFSEQSFALDLLYFVCEVRRPGVNDVKASSSWRTLDLIPIKDQWSHLEDTRSNTNELYQRININNHHQRILHQNYLLDTAEDEKIRLGLLDFDSCKTQLLIKYFTDYWQRSTTKGMNNIRYFGPLHKIDKWLKKSAAMFVNSSRYAWGFGPTR